MRNPVKSGHDVQPFEEIILRQFELDKLFSFSALGELAELRILMVVNRTGVQTSRILSRLMDLRIGIAERITSHREKSPALVVPIVVHQ